MVLMVLCRCLQTVLNAPALLAAANGRATSGRIVLAVAAWASLDLCQPITKLENLK
jgi:hypothetical protein